MERGGSVWVTEKEFGVLDRKEMEVVPERKRERVGKR